MQHKTTQYIKTVVILQSSYIPWKGYFDLINMADEFILYDDVQFTPRDWRNRNAIKTAQGAQWITIPLKIKGFYKAPINVMEPVDESWASAHYKQLSFNYSKAPYFSQYAPAIKEIYLGCANAKLSEINATFIRELAAILGIKTAITRSEDYAVTGSSSARLLNLCKASGADYYLSGPAAKQYLDESIFNNEGIKVGWMDYTDYPSYHQLYPPFVHQVSILDLLFNEGPQANKFMKSF